MRVRPSVLICVDLIVSCAPAHTFRVPEQTHDGWQTTSLDEVGIDESRIKQAIDRVRDNSYQNIHSILIVKDDKLVFEEYFSGYAWDYNDDQFRGELTDFGIDTIHNLASVTKSFTSTLVGIAIDHGFIRDVDEEIFAFFPEYANLSEGKKSDITVTNLLTMTSGLEWNEMEFPYSNTRNDLVQLFIVSDPVEYILAKPVVNEPGAIWYYNGGGTNLFGEVIREATGVRMDVFADQYLFEPFGITDYKWDYLNSEIIHASGNLELRPRDMAKLGYLFLKGGIWKGERIVSEEWIEEATQSHASPSWADGYGYQWWIETYHSNSTSTVSFFAAGWGGQRITVFPSLDMVVVFTGGNYIEEDPVDDINTRYILPAAY